MKESTKCSSSKGDEPSLRFSRDGIVAARGYWRRMIDLMNKKTKITLYLLLQSVDFTLNFSTLLLNRFLLCTCITFTTNQWNRQSDRTITLRILILSTKNEPMGFSYCIDRQEKKTKNTDRKDGESNRILESWNEICFDSFRLYRTIFISFDLLELSKWLTRYFTLSQSLLELFVGNVAICGTNILKENSQHIQFDSVPRKYLPKNDQNHQEY